MLNCDLNHCYGCQACEQICPTSAITMKDNNEGFIYPTIDESKCTNCNLCNSVCPIDEKNRSKIVYPQSNNVFGVWDKDISRRMASTSGGAFSGLASYVLEQGGVVYGCAWQSNDNLRAVHIRVDNKEELLRLKGSKYVQSYIGSSFTDAKRDLKNGTTVLYSGTPCQIAGLRLFLKKDYPNLYTVDLVCHGTPSPLMLKSYIDTIEQKEGGKISNFKFRDKKMNDPRAFVSYTRPNNKKKYSIVGSESYFKGFGTGCMNRESCYTCQYSSPDRVGDITVADYWGVEHVQPEIAQHRFKGMSVLLSNSEKGLNLFDKAMTNDYHIHASNFANASAHNIRLVTTEHRPASRDTVYLDFNQHGYEWVSNKYFRVRFKTLHQLTPWRLVKFIKWLLKK